MRKLTITSLFIVLVSMAAAVPGFAATDPSPDSSSEQQFLSLVNQERTSRGLRALRWSSRLGSIARDHSGDMARRGELYHNDNLPSDVGSYSALAENVGNGSDAPSIHQAFMDSSGHRRNVLGSFTQIGVGVMTDESGALWVTEIFYTPAQSSSTTTTTRTATRRTVTNVSTPVSRPRYRAAALAVLEVRVPAAGKAVVEIAEPAALQTVGALKQLAGAYA